MGIRDRLLGRSIPPTLVTIRADFSPESDAALAEVEAARRDLLIAEASGADLGPAQDRLTAAETAAAVFVEVLQVVVLPPDEYDGLIGEHPPPDEQRAQGALWNSDTFAPALLAACMQQDGQPVMSADDWRAWAKTPGAVTSGEYAALFNACVRANDRTPDVHVGKGSGGTPSSA